jgi:hypothetical protein
MFIITSALEACLEQHHLDRLDVVSVIDSATPEVVVACVPRPDLGSHVGDVRIPSSHKHDRPRGSVVRLVHVVTS